MDSTKAACERLRAAKKASRRHPRKGVIDRRVNLKPRLRCRHDYDFRSHMNFKDGEYYVCRKCGKVKF